jgi:hypothetical protein
MGSAGAVNPQWIYNQLIAQGVSPHDAEALTAIAGRESSYSSTAESGNRGSTGDYFSTGLFQENLGWGYGPGGSQGSGPSQQQNIHGQAVQAQLGGNAYNDLYGNPLNDIRAAAALDKSQGLRPWEKNPNDPNSWRTGIPDADLLIASQAAGGTLQGNAAENLKQNAPQITQDAINKSDLQQQSVLNQAMAGLNSQFAQEEAGFQNQLLGLSQQSLGIQRGQLARLGKEYPQLHNIQLQQNALTLQGMHQSETDTKRQYAQMFRDQSANAAASGSTFSKGNRDQTTLERQQEASALSGISRQERSLGLTQRSENIQFQEQMTNLRDQNKNLDILAQRYGISAQEIKTRLSNTLQQMGYQSQMTEADLAAAIASTDVSMGALVSGSIAPPPQGVYGLGGGGGGSTATQNYPTTPTG